uniref:Uncharacterized protein n=1 Tax=Heterorhabditis bacteriophora TaxID=37862 RepID=A0A1I7XSE9_HETBA
MLRTDVEHREWQLRMRQLESQLNELRVVKTKLECRIAEMEEELTRETQAAHELSVTLERETQMRIQLERRLQQWREGSNGDDRISRVSSTARFESDEKVLDHYH